MLVYQEQSANGVQVENFDTEEEDEDCEIQKPHMLSTKDEEHMEDHAVYIILIFDLQMIHKFVNNNYKNEGFGIQRFEDYMLRVSVELVEVFTCALGVFV